MKQNIGKTSGTRFLDPEILSKISGLELLARTVVEGFVSGLHKSPYRGFSVEFMEYRPYIPGDDMARIDWKLYARSDRLYVKEYEDETNTSCHILLDISNSMGYTSAKMNKFEYGSYLAASLAYFIIRQRDSVGMCLFDDKIVQRISPKSTTGHLYSILTSLENSELGKNTSFRKPFHELADAIKRKGFIIIISDLLEEPEGLIDGLKHFRFDGHEVIVFHILDPFELNYQFKDIIELEDMETGEKVLVSPESAKEVYTKNLEIFRDTVRKECGILGIDYKTISTDRPLDFALFQYLSSRSKRLK
ncbi:DUF58 domain-containing protein [candidate division KSB1 bacterium]